MCTHTYGEGGARGRLCLDGPCVCQRRLTFSPVAADVPFCSICCGFLPSLLPNGVSILGRHACGRQRDPMTNYQSFLHSTKRQRMPADHILNLLLILKLARQWVEAGRCSHTAPQPQHKHRQRNSSSHCTTDSKCLGKEVLKITQCNKISGPEAPGSMFFQPLDRIEITV